MTTTVSMAAAMAVANGERTPGLGPEQPRGPPAPAAPTPRARHEAEVAGHQTDLRLPSTAAPDLRARPAGVLRAPSSSARRSYAPAFAARSSGERSSAAPWPPSAPASRFAPPTPSARSLAGSRRRVRRERGEEEMKLGFGEVRPTPYFIWPGETRGPLDLIRRPTHVGAATGRREAGGGRHIPGPGPGFWAWSPGREATQLAGPGQK